MRQSNEDRSIHFRIDENTYLLLLADGMGGYADGHLAAELAIEEISNYIKFGNEIDIEQKIELAFTNAHRAIRERLHNAGATVGGILFSGENIYVFWAGDVKITLINGNNAYSSKEHSLLNVLRDAQIFIKSEEIGRLTHTVVRSVGGDSKSYIPEIVKMKRGETFKGVLYSDGMHSYYTTDEIVKMLRDNTCNSLNEKFDTSIFNDSKDNVTGIFFIV